MTKNTKSNKFLRKLTILKHYYIRKDRLKYNLPIILLLSKNFNKLNILLSNKSKKLKINFEFLANNIKVFSNFCSSELIVVRN